MVQLSLQVLGLWQCMKLTISLFSHNSLQPSSLWVMKPLDIIAAARQSELEFLASKPGQYICANSRDG